MLKPFTILTAPCATASRREGPKEGEEVEESRTGSSHVVVPRVERQVAQCGAAQMVFDRHALRCTRPSRHAAGSLQASCQAHNMASENTTSPAKLGHATCTCTAGRIPHKRRPRGGDGRRPGCERGAWNSRARLRSDTAVPRSSQSVAFTSATALPGRAASQSPLHRLSFITTVRTSSGPRRQEGTAPGPQVPGRLRTWAHGGRGREEGRGREGGREGGRERWRQGKAEEEEGAVEAGADRRQT